jgi:hypothetical protein
MLCCYLVDGLNLERPFLLSFPRREVAVPLWRVTRSEIKWKVREHVIYSRHEDDSVDSGLGISSLPGTYPSGDGCPDLLIQQLFESWRKGSFRAAYTLRMVVVVIDR